MKRLSLYIFLIFFTLQTTSQANDIRDFQIEGMSIGDSGLKYFSKDLIEKEESIKSHYNDNEFFLAWFPGHGNYEIYEFLQIHFKTNDKNYIIYSLEGKIIYKDNISDCYNQKDKIVKELKSIFPNAKIRNNKNEHKADPTGKSLTDTTYFYFDTSWGRDKGNIGVACYDWSIESGKYDNLKVFIDSGEFKTWLDDKAWK